MSFIGPSYTLNARKADTQRAVNIFPVMNEVAGGKSVSYLDSIPGLTEFSVVAPVGALLMESRFYLLTEGGFRILL